MADMLDLDNRMASILDPRQFAAQAPASAVTR
jgi:carboxyl-terminal processing protease